MFGHGSRPDAVRHGDNDGDEEEAAVERVIASSGDLRMCPISGCSTKHLDDFHVIPAVHLDIIILDVPTYPEDFQLGYVPATTVSTLAVGPSQLGRTRFLVPEPGLQPV